MAGRRFACFCLLALSVVIGASISVAMLSSPRGDQPIRLLLVTNGSDAYGRALAVGATRAAQECGVELAVQSADSTGRERLVQSTTESTLVGIHGAIVSLGANDNAVQELGRLTQATDIVTCGVDANGDALIHVGTNQYSAGRICGGLAKEVLPEGGRVVAITANDEVSTTRLAALEESLRRCAKGHDEEWRVITQSANGDADSFDGQLNDLLRNDEGPVCVIDVRNSFSPGSTGDIAAIAASRGINFITFDGSHEALAAVETGEVLAVISEDAYAQGYQAVQHLASICQGNHWRRPAPGHGQVNVPVTVVRQGNVAEHRAHLLAAVRSPAA